MAAVAAVKSVLQRLAAGISGDRCGPWRHAGHRYLFQISPDEATYCLTCGYGWELLGKGDESVICNTSFDPGASVSVRYLSKADLMAKVADLHGISRFPYDIALIDVKQGFVRSAGYRIILYSCGS